MPYRDPEKDKAWRKIWLAATRDKRNAQARAWREANPKKQRRSEAAYYLRNRDEMNAKARAYQKANPDKVRAAELAWRKENPEKCKAIFRRYYLRKRAPKRRPTDSAPIRLRDHRKEAKRLEAVARVKARLNKRTPNDALSTRLG
jgi:hypothetical protein